MEYKDSPYFSVARATDLTGKDRLIYRSLEMMPGLLSWATIFGTIVLSFFAPVAAAYFIIAFDLYWLLKNAYLAIHLRHNWKRIKHNLSLDWEKMLENTKYEHIYHMIILPFYKEDFSVVDQSIGALLDTKYDKKKMIIVLAREERGGDSAEKVADDIQKRYEDKFGHFLVTVHPSGMPGEIPGKGSNISYAAEDARKKILEIHNLPYTSVIVSAFDVDTVAYEQYFLCLTWHYLTCPDPQKVSFQPVPFYNNNIWHAPALSRVVAASSTFWQMIQQERPEKLATFSSHSVSFQTLYEIGYWQKNMVSEDSRIFWNLLLARNGDYSVVPISYPVSMDANLAPTFFGTMKNIYKQHRRWTWGVENIPYILFGFIKNKNIPFRIKLRMSFVQIEGFWSLATNPIMIFLLGWLPVVLGGYRFNATILSYNLPFLTRNLMIISMLGLILTAIIYLSFLPPKPEKRSRFSKIYMGLQWIFIPFTIVIFGAIPGLDAQTRLLFAKYMGFWVTPKHRKT